MADNTSEPLDTPTPARDPRYDIARGVALIGITLHHTFGPAHTVIRVPQVFYFDFAGVFVLVSGCVGGLAFAKAHERGGNTAILKRCWKRAAQLWLANSLTLAITIAGFWLLTRHVGQVQHEALRYFTELSWEKAGSWLLPHKGADFFDVLMLYAVLLLVTPAFVAMMAVRWWLGLAGSLAVYAAAWWSEAQGLIGERHYAYAGAFDVPGWQLLFVLGLTIGWAMKRRIRLLPRGDTWWWLALGLVIAGCWLKAEDVLSSVWYSKWDNRPLYWMHLLLVGALLWHALPGTHSIWQATPARALAMLGHRPLPIYCLTVLHAFFAGALIELLQLSRWQSYTLQAAGLSLIGCVAWWLYRQGQVQRA